MKYCMKITERSATSRQKRFEEMEQRFCSLSDENQIIFRSALQFANKSSPRSLVIEKDAVWPTE
jgi:hypothetical protein